MTPRLRPQLGLRVLAGLLGVGVLLVSTALLISDRAPGVLSRVLGGYARRLSERIDAGGRARLAAGAEAAKSDFLVHVAIWAVVIVLVGMAIWTWRGLLVASVGVFACSVLVEAGQGLFSELRTVQFSDLVGNALGVALGAVVVACCYLLWSALASRFGPSP